MINVIYDKPKKLAGKQSIFVTFPYDQDIVNTIRHISERHWDKKEKVWELPYEYVSFLKKNLPKKSFNIKGTPIDEKKHGVKELVKKYDLPKELKTNLFSYQKEAYQVLMNYDNFLLLDSQGLGKSIEAIAVALKRKEAGVKHTLIIAGKNGLKYNWVREINTHTDGETVSVLGERINKKGKPVIKSNKDKLEDLNNISTYFIVTNIETLRDNDINNKLKSLCANGTIGFIIVDEAHVCKSPSSIQGKALLKLKPTYKLAMTGTILTNSPLDSFIPMKWIGAEPATFTAFKLRYCTMGGFGGYQIVGYKHLDELQDKLDSVSIRRTKEEVLDLPPKVYMTEYVEMGREQSKLYKNVLDSIMEHIDKIRLSPNPLSQLIRLRQATADTSILSSTVSESAKFDRAEELVEEAVGNKEKVVIFSSWTEVTSRIAKRLQEYNPAVITGEVKDRESQIDKFKHDDSCKVIIGTIPALGTGYTLTEASTAIFLDLPYTWANFEQAADRIYRVGTTKSVNIITLVCKNTIDERVLSIVEHKKRLSDGVVDKKYNLSDPTIVDFLLS